MSTENWGSHFENNTQRLHGVFDGFDRPKRYRQDFELLPKLEAQLTHLPLRFDQQRRIDDHRNRRRFQVETNEQLLPVLQKKPT